MSRPFNFYQEANTGMGEFIAPFATVFTGSGIYLPPDLFVGLNARWIMNLGQDDVIYPSKLSVRVRGTENQSTPDSWGLSYSFTASVFPLLRDTGNFSTDMTGAQISGNSDAPPISVDYTGQQSSGFNDTFNNKVIISGYVTGVKYDSANMSDNFSGKLASGYNTVATLSCDFYGTLNKGNTDDMNFNVGITSIVYSQGPVRHFVTGTGIMQGNVVITSIIYQAAF